MDLEKRHSPALQIGNLDAARAFLEYLPYPVMLIGADYDIHWLNAAGRETYGAETGRCHRVSHGYGEPCFFHGEPCPKLLTDRTGEPASVGHVHRTTVKPGFFKVTALPLSDGRVLELHVPLEEVFTRDAVTGVYSRHFFEQLVQRQLPLLKRLSLRFSLVMIDVDRLKPINDLHGHLAGDRVIQAVAQAIQDNVRTADSVGRWGGDEYCVFLPSAGQRRAEAIVRRIQQAVRRIRLPEGPPGRGISASFGICTSADVYDLKAAIEAADDALYRAKAAGRNCIRGSWEPDPAAGGEGPTRHRS